ATLKFNLGIDPACIQGGDGGSLDGERVRKVERTDLRRNVQANRAAGRDIGQEVQANTEFPERHGDLTDAAASALQVREREFAAGDKARFLAVHGEHVGFGQDLQNVLTGKCLDGGADIGGRVEQHQIQRVAK